DLGPRAGPPRRRPCEAARGGVPRPAREARARWVLLAARALRASPRDGDPQRAPPQRDQNRRGVVRVVALEQRSIRVRAMYEPVAPRGDPGDVEVLALLYRRVVVAVAHRDPLRDPEGERVVRRAVARVPRR